MDNVVHALVKEVNSSGISAYQEETKGESSTLQTERETEVIHNLTTNLISEEKLFEILKEIQEVIDCHPKVISKGEWDISHTDLVEHKIYLEYDCPIKRPVRY